MVDEENLRARYELHYLGNGPMATGSSFSDADIEVFEAVPRHSQFS
jgi:hypothetical protein